VSRWLLRLLSTEQSTEGKEGGEVERRRLALSSSVKLGGALKKEGRRSRGLTAGAKEAEQEEAEEGVC
jgi:hypothetical protein